MNALPKYMSDEDFADWLLWEQTDEDRAAIADFFEEERRVAQGQARVLARLQESTQNIRARQRPVIDDARMAGHFPRACSCCGVIILSLAAWKALPAKGIQRDESGAPLLEYRDCACQSTLAIPVSVGAA